MKTQADNFIRAMNTLDVFSRREIFVSLTLDSDSQLCELVFRDGSKAYNHWYARDGQMIIEEGVA